MTVVQNGFGSRTNMAIILLNLNLNMMPCMRQARLTNLILLFPWEQTRIKV